MHREQIALRFPEGTKARLQAVAQPHESQTATILRAIEALERHPPEQPSDATERRLSEIERRLSAIERRQPQGDIQGHLATSRRSHYHDEVRQLAVRLKQQGQRNAEIRDQLINQFGAAPGLNNMGRALAAWAKQLGLDPMKTDD